MLFVFETSLFPLGTHLQPVCVRNLCYATADRRKKPQASLWPLQGGKKFKLIHDTSHLCLVGHYAIFFMLKWDTCPFYLRRHTCSGKRENSEPRHSFSRILAANHPRQPQTSWVMSYAGAHWRGSRSELVSCEPHLGMCKLSGPICWGGWLRRRGCFLSFHSQQWEGLAPLAIWGIPKDSDAANPTDRRHGAADHLQALRMLP